MKSQKEVFTELGLAVSVLDEWPNRAMAGHPEVKELALVIEVIGNEVHAVYHDDHRLKDAFLLGYTQQEYCAAKAIIQKQSGVSK